MTDYAIVTLSGYLDIFLQFWLTCEQYEERARKICVTSGAMSKFKPSMGWGWERGPEPFSFPHNANIGIRAAAPADVFLVNDDVQFLAPDSVRKLAEIAHAHPEVGVLSPQFEGMAGNRLQHRQFAKLAGLTCSTERLAFTGVYIRRAVLDAVGSLDERFTGYGREDDDYCRRVRAVGLELAVTPDVVMRHGHGDQQHSASFKRTPRYPANGIDPAMTKLYVEKWGDAK